MDFIEQLFGISPDGGDGATELMLFIVPIAVVCLLIYWRKRQRPAA